MRRSSRTSRTSSTRSSTTSTCASTSHLTTGAGPGRGPQAGSSRRRGPAVRARRRAGRRRLDAPGPAAVRRRGAATRCSTAAGPRRLVTFDDLVLRLQAALTRPGHRPAGVPAAARRATRWCSSTSSRTPTPPSGRSCAEAFHGHRHPDPDRGPEAGDLRVPRRRRVQLPRRGRTRRPHATLPTNHRSDAAVVRGIADLLGGLRARRRAHRRASGARRRTLTPRLVGLPGQRGRSGCGPGTPPTGQLPAVGRARAPCADDVAADIVATLTGPSPAASTTTAPSVRWPPATSRCWWPRTCRAAAVRDALARAGVPVVISLGGQRVRHPGRRERG